MTSPGQGNQSLMVTCIYSHSQTIISLISLNVGVLQTGLLCKVILDLVALQGHGSLRLGLLMNMGTEHMPAR